MPGVRLRTSAPISYISSPKKYSWTHINQVACALRFFYGVTLGQKDALERIVFGREPEKLTPVLAPEEVAQFLEAVVGLRNRVALTTAYAAGLRVGEVARLKVAAIDSRRMLILVENGKGGRVWRDICGTAPRASAFFRHFIQRDRCGHMSGLSARSWTAGLDEIRDARG